MVAISRVRRAGSDPVYFEEYCAQEAHVCFARLLIDSENIMEDVIKIGIDRRMPSPLIKSMHTMHQLLLSSRVFASLP